MRMEPRASALPWLNKTVPLTVLLVWLILPCNGNFFTPFNVSYDGRAVIINGQRRMLISAGIHYPRATPEMWPNLIAKSKEGGVDVIETYVFWNGHEPVKGQYYFEGRYDIVNFVKHVGSAGLYLLLRIGPYACAEWNFGGFPVWLRDVPGIEFRTDNSPFKDEMERFVKMIVDLMRAESLFSWQGGPIILLQIENEYGNVESEYGSGGKRYLEWAAQMAFGLRAGVPWIMCKQTDAPEYIIDACNGYYCDDFSPNSDKKPKLWTENWDGWYTSWGERIPHRPAEDIAFAIARFFQRRGSLSNYYMYFGGTNFGRTAGGPNQITSYDYDALIDEYGLLRQPKWGHMKDLHSAIKLCEPALIAVDSPQYISLGPLQEAHVYGINTLSNDLNLSLYGSKCSAFLANIDEHDAATVTFYGQVYTLPPWSVSILPDCRNVAFNTAKIGVQTSIKTVGQGQAAFSDAVIQTKVMAHSWMFVVEPIGAWGNIFTYQGILEHLKVTKDQSDYLWYTTRQFVLNEDILFWEKGNTTPTLTIDSMRDFMCTFINGQLAGCAKGNWVKVVQPVKFVQGFNDIVLLSQTVGLQNYGAFLEKDGAGFRGQVKLTGWRNGDIDLNNSSWTYQVGLKGEFLEAYAGKDSEDFIWNEYRHGSTPHIFSWYKTYFDAPVGTDPVAIDLSGMGKGQVWVNGQHIGRYWTLKAPEDGCNACDYRGKYNSDKCVTNCGQSTQSWYHIPRSWLLPSNNLLVIFEETNKAPLQISIEPRFTSTICSQVSQDHYPPLNSWSGGQILNNIVAPELHLQCDDGHIISSIVFASYGTPQGYCQQFSLGNCHASSSSSVTSEACQGKNSCSIEVSDSIFGDPCPYVIKTLAVQAICSALIDSGLPDISVSRKL